MAQDTQGELWESLVIISCPPLSPPPPLSCSLSGHWIMTMKDAVRGPLDVAPIAVSAGNGLKDWGLVLKPPGVSALWPVFLRENSVQNV